MSDKLQPLVIAGFGRSGTTWLQDSIAAANQLRAVFEPLNPDAIRGAEPYAYRFVSASASAPELYRLLRHYFFDEFHSPWADYRIIAQKLVCRPADLASWARTRRILRQYERAFRYLRIYRRQRQYSRRIVKFVRANMMLSWLKQTFDARIVFIVRHPAAVVTSQLHSLVSWKPYARIEQFRKDNGLLEMLGEGSRKLLFQSLDEIEACTLLWCIENQEALRQVRESNIHAVFYEDLIRDGQCRWREITSVLGLEIVPSEELVALPSQQAWGRQAEDPAVVHPYAAWTRRIDEATTTRIQSILDAAHVDFYHVGDPLPSNRDAYVSYSSINST